MLCEHLGSISDGRGEGKRFTVELTAHQLHAQGAGLATHHGNDADVLGHDGRVKQVGLGAVVIDVPHEDLRKSPPQNLQSCQHNRVT